MRYFILKQSPLLKHTLTIYGLNTSQYKYNLNQDEFEKLNGLVVAYFKNSPECELPEVVKQPTFMISDTLKKLFQIYDKEIRFKGIQVYSDKLEDMYAKLYWTFMASEADCLHADCEILPNGEYKKIILDKNKIPDKDIFKVAGIPTNVVVLSLTAAESVMRRKLFGVSLEEAELR